MSTSKDYNIPKILLKKKKRKKGILNIQMKKLACLFCLFYLDVKERKKNLPTIMRLAMFLGRIFPRV